MPIQVVCACGRKLQVRDEFAGQQGKCPSCGKMLDIPHSEAIPTIPVARAVPLDESGEEPPREREQAREEEQARGKPLEDHQGKPLPADVDLFAPPPQEVGPLFSAYSTMNKGQKPRPLSQRLLLSGAAALGVWVLGLGVIKALDITTDFFIFFWLVVPEGLVFLIVMLATRFKHRCTYVGREGVARFECSGDRDNLSTREVFRFRDGAEVRSAQTNHFTNGSYTHTSYTVTWTDVGGRQRYAISGTHRSRQGTPGKGDPYHFARAAEIAWTIYLLEQAYRQLDLAGTVLFTLGGGRWVRLGPGVVILGLSGQPVECQANELSGVSVQQGVVCIRRHDAKEGWFSSSGVYKFGFAELANAQLFFHLMERVVGIPVA